MVVGCIILLSSCLMGCAEVQLQDITSTQSLDQGTLELGSVTLEFSEKPTIHTRVHTVPGSKYQQIELVCPATSCNNITPNPVRLHSSIPYTCTIIPLSGKQKGVTCMMQFDPKKVHITIDEIDTAKGVSLVVHVYDQNRLGRLGGHQSSMLRIA